MMMMGGGDVTASSPVPPPLLNLADGFLPMSNNHGGGSVASSPRMVPLTILSQNGSPSGGNSPLCHHHHHASSTSSPVLTAMGSAIAASSPLMRSLDLVAKQDKEREDEEDELLERERRMTKTSGEKMMKTSGEKERKTGHHPPLPWLAMRPAPQSQSQAFPSPLILSLGTPPATPSNHIPDDCLLAPTLHLRLPAIKLSPRGGGGKNGVVQAVR